LSIFNSYNIDLIFISKVNMESAIVQVSKEESFELRESLNILLVSDIHLAYENVTKMVDWH